MQRPQLLIVAGVAGLLATGTGKAANRLQSNRDVVHEPGTAKTVKVPPREVYFDRAA